MAPRRTSSATSPSGSATRRTLNTQRFALALLLFALIPVVTNVDAPIAIGVVDVLLWMMIAYETMHVYDERRYRLRHGLDIDLPEAATPRS